MDNDSYTMLFSYACTTQMVINVIDSAENILETGHEIDALVNFEPFVVVTVEHGNLNQVGVCCMLGIRATA